jgi:hypothetical protein
MSDSIGMKRRSRGNGQQFSTCRSAILLFLGVLLITRLLTTFHHEACSSSEETTVIAKKDARTRFDANRRKFVSYHSSPLEQLWLDNINDWSAKEEICSQIVDVQAATTREFLILTCTTHLPSPYEDWCIIDDAYEAVWVNKTNKIGFEISVGRPPTVPESVVLPPPQPVLPTKSHEHLVSKFVFLDEYTGETYVEYIEPLISHLRMPLSICDAFINVGTWNTQWNGLVHRGYIIPPPPLNRHKRHYYFDAGASSWSTGTGGPSLEYFTTMWKRHDIDFTDIYAWEMTTPVDTFYLDVPKEYEDRTHYQQCAVSSNIQEHSRTTPFIPFVIQQKTTSDDYVFFKVRHLSGLKCLLYS